jgi:hypothetical protein
MIYVLRTDGLSEVFFKIGYTKRDVKKRITALQTGCPMKIELVKIMQGSQQKERELHATLKRSRTIGEWYKDDFFVRKTLDLYDWKGFPAKDYTPNKDQARVTEALKGFNGCHFWALGSFLKEFNITEEDLRTTPFGERVFNIGLLDYSVVSGIGEFHGDPFKGSLLCIGKH